MSNLHEFANLYTPRQPLTPIPRWIGKRMARNSFAILRWLAIFIFVSAGVKVSWDVWHMLLFEMSALNTDAYIYLTVGRGILNGLRPYTDLFESKPPGIFYLNALSLWLTNGTFLLRMLQAGNLLSLPIVLIGFVWFRERTWNWRTGAMLFTAFIMGCLLALGAEENAPGLQTEVFGVLPSVLYALSISGRPDWKRTIFSGTCIFFAVILREPFILGILAAALGEQNIERISSFLRLSGAHRWSVGFAISANVWIAPTVPACLPPRHAQ